MSASSTEQQLMRAAQEGDLDLFDDLVSVSMIPPDGFFAGFSRFGRPFLPAGLGCAIRLAAGQEGVRVSISLAPAVGEKTPTATLHICVDGF